MPTSKTLYAISIYNSFSKIISFYETKNKISVIFYKQSNKREEI